MSSVSPSLIISKNCDRTLSLDLDPTGFTVPVRLGAVSTALGDNIPGVLVRCAQQAPDAKLTIVPGTSRDLYEQVNDGRLDAAFVIKPAIELPKALDCIVLERQPFVVITQVNDVRSLDQIVAQTHALIYDTTSWGGRIAQPWLKKHVPADRILCELDALEAMLVRYAIFSHFYKTWVVKMKCAQFRYGKHINLPEVVKVHGVFLCLGIGA